MNRLVEIRKQEFICRERAILDSERKNFWLAKAQEWEQRALEEMHFTSRNAIAIAPIVKLPRRPRGRCKLLSI
jgi:hypothetical protein